MAFSPQFLDEVRDRSGLVSVIGRRVRLQKKGREYLGLCPFHNEKTPSFTVNEDKGFYHCFGCGEHGSVFDFVMKVENLSFPEAVERLASEAGMEMPVDTPEERERAKRAATHYEVLERACVYYEKQLRLPEGLPALSYLQDRGVTEDAIRTFRLGYAPEKRSGLRGDLVREGAAEQLMIEAGLLIQPDDRGRSPYDRFRGRVMFPIMDHRSRVIAFGGRILENGEPKYLNSPETPTFHKGRTLYGIAQALAPARKKQQLIVAEGYTDVISMHQSGIENVVASSGTALTPGQIRLIKRFTPNITILFDGDPAGIRASFRGIDLILEEGMNVKVVPFPEGEDPDSYSKRVSSDELVAYLDEHAQDFISYKSNTVLAETKNDPIKKAGLIREVLDSIALVPNQISRSVYIQQTSQQFEIAEQTLISELNKILRNNQKKDRREQGYTDADTLDLIVPETKTPEKEPAPGIDLDYQEFDLIRLMLLYGSFGVEVEIESEDGSGTEKIEIPVVQFILEELEESDISLSNERAKLILNEFQIAARDGIIPNLKHFVNHENQEISSCAVNLSADRHYLSENWTKMHNIYPETEEMKLQRAVEEAVWIYKLRRVRLMKAELGVRLKNKLSPDEEAQVMSTIIKYNEIISVISYKLNIVVAK